RPCSRFRYRPLSASYSAREETSTDSRRNWSAISSMRLDSVTSGRLKGLFRDRHEVREGARIGDGERGEHLPVDLAPRLLEAVPQPAVGDVVLTSGGVDSPDPQPAEFALLRLPVAVGVAERLLDLLLGDPVRLGFGSVIAFRKFQDFCAAVLPL